jgi:hypothetical protein
LDKECLIHVIENKHISELDSLADESVAEVSVCFDIIELSILEQERSKLEEKLVV